MTKKPWTAILRDNFTMDWSYQGLFRQWVFNGKRVDDYIDASAVAFKYGTFMYQSGKWFRCSAYGPAPKRKEWKPVDEQDVPKEYRAWVLIL